MIMVDTGAWYAICDASDRNHGRAKEFYEQVAGTIPLVTTDIILAETWTLLAARLGRPATITFGEAAVSFDRHFEQYGWQVLRSR